MEGVMKKFVRTVLFFFLVVAFAGSGNWYIETNPVSGDPEAVWNAIGTSDESHEIRWSYLDGTEWAPSIALTSDSIDDYDPKLAFDSSGNRKAVWWSDDSYDTIKYSKKPASGGSWSTPDTISSSTENCQYPFLVVHNGTVHFSYERINSSNYRDVLTSIEEDPSPFPQAVVASTQRTDKLETIIHSVDGHLWIDWIDSDSNLGYSEKVNGTWQTAQYESYSGEEDIEDGRQRIRVEVVGN
jgi:hypothetical protein